MSVRILADDLTGALDTAAEFTGLAGPVGAFWHGALPDCLPATAALDSGTREYNPEQAAVIAGALAGHLAGASIAFKKIDSLLRGPTISELAACYRAGHWRHCVLAPAFPFQGRITRNGCQYAKAPDGSWTQVGGDLIAELQALGITAQAGRPGQPLAPGISVFAAETDDDLRRVVSTARRCGGNLLWSGTGGLAQAISAGSQPPTPLPLPQPVLGLFGSDQTATARQLAACAPHWILLHDADPKSAGAVRERLAAADIALVSFSHPEATPRDIAADRIARQMRRLVGRLDRPGSLIVAGGETLRSLCLALGATGLEVQGRIVPGVPLSVMRGGRWDGIAVVSKSGAFGPPDLLRDVLHLPRRDIPGRDISERDCPAELSSSASATPRPGVTGPGHQNEMAQPLMSDQSISYRTAPGLGAGRTPS